MSACPMPFLYERQVIPIIKITSYQLLPPFDNSRKAEVNGKWGAGYFSNNHLCITRGRDTECKETKKAPSACLFCPDALSHLGSPYRNEGPFLQMVPLLGRSLVPLGWIRGQALQSYQSFSAFFSYLIGHRQLSHNFGGRSYARDCVRGSVIQGLNSQHRVVDK